MIRKEKWFQKVLKFLCPYKLDLEWNVGDMVIDDLTSNICEVKGIEFANGKCIQADGKVINSYGCVGIWIDNEWLDGGRHPWEISEPLSKEEIKLWQPVIDRHRLEMQQKKSTKPKAGSS